MTISQVIQESSWSKISIQNYIELHIFNWEGVPTSKTRAMIPAAMGDEAEVPVWEEVHLQIFAKHEITLVKIFRDKITIIVNAVSGLKLFWGTIWFRLFAVLDAVLTWLLINVTTWFFVTFHEGRSWSLSSLPPCNIWCKKTNVCLKQCNCNYCRCNFFFKKRDPTVKTFSVLL